MSNQSGYGRRAEVPAHGLNSCGSSAPAVRSALLLVAFALFSVCASAESWKLRMQADLAYQRGDFKTALQKYTKLAKEKGGSAHAECQLGIMFERGEGMSQDAAQAVNWYRLAAEKGDPTAAMNLALILDFGKGVQADHTEAIRWYRLAAERGDVIAQYNLGCNYENGTGVAIDFAQAVRWFQQAASKEYAKAQIALGRLYWSGNGVQQDLIDAATLFLVASRTNDPEDTQKAMKNLELLRDQMIADDLTKAEHIANAHIATIERRRLEQEQRAEAERAEQEAAAAEMAEAQAYTGPSYWDIANQGLQNTLARQQAAIAAGRAQQQAAASRAQQAAAISAQQSAALASVQGTETRQAVTGAMALAASQQNPNTSSGKFPMELHNECIDATAKLDPTGAGTSFFFTNRCSQLVVIKEFTQSADGSWHGGEDCRSPGQWVEAYESTTSAAKYIAWAQFVNSCSQELFLQWPAAPR
jgi:uncharacterized protein